MNARALAQLGLLAVLASGCGVFGGGKDTGEPPAELVDFESSLPVRKVWSTKVGGGTERLRLGLVPATDGTRVYAGSYEGDVAAIDLERGRKLWSVDTELPLSAGPAFGGGLLVLGSADGDLVALEAETGEERWRRAVGSEVLAAPVIVGNVVVFRSVDGRLRAVSTATGEEQWSVEQSVPALSLRGNTAPRASGNVVVSGFDNGRVGAYEVASGAARWEVPIAAPAGVTELDRLVDVSAGLQIVGNDVYVASYQGRAVGIDLTTGLVLWQQELSSFSGLGADAGFVYVANDVSAVLALNRNNGIQAWIQEALRLRDITAPTRFREAVVVGDYEGYLHFLNPVDGSFMARVRAGSERVTAAPLVVGLTLVTQADDGTVTAFTVVEDDSA
jgi:outer membrane protein assembly factor BamB